MIIAKVASALKGRSAFKKAKMNGIAAKLIALMTNSKICSK